jgi:galactonate dehydratase
MGGLAEASDIPNLVVTELEVLRVHVNQRGNWTILRLHASGGLTGLGDASISSNEADTLVFLKQFSQLLRGRSIFDVEWFRTTVAAAVAKNGAYGRNPAAIAASGIEQCLWDLQGKALSVPTYDLFGGRIQPRIRQYANINRSTTDRTPDGFAKMAAKAVEAGFDAVKLAPFDGMPRGLHQLPRGLEDRVKMQKLSDLGVSCARAVRETIGSDRDLLVDAHGHFDLAEGLDLVLKFEPLHLYWLEEVTSASPLENLAAIRKAATMPTAGGESIHGVAGFVPYIKAETVDITMPDVRVCGGMLELKKIAALSEGAGLLTSPHGPFSPIGNATAAHVMSTVPNFNILEFSYGEVPWRAELIDPPEELDRGALVLSKRPGLGFKLNEKVVSKYAIPL